MFPRKRLFSNIVGCRNDRYESNLDVPTEKQMLPSRLAINRPLSLEAEESLKVCIFGPSNCGKSSITNALIGKRICGTSPVAGTTLVPLSVSLTREHKQLILMDTPPLEKYPENIIKMAKKCDVLLPVIDNVSDTVAIEALMKSIRKECEGKPFLLALNKTDFYDKIEESLNMEKLRNKFGDEIGQIYPLSSLHGFGIMELQKSLFGKAICRANAWEYNSRQNVVISDLERVKLVVREKLLRLYHWSFVNAPFPLVSQVTVGWDNRMVRGTLNIGQTLFISDRDLFTALSDQQSSRNKLLRLEIQNDLFEHFNRNVLISIFPVYDPKRAKLDYLPEIN